MGDFTFGHRAADNGRLVGRLRKDAGMTKKTDERVVTFIREMTAKYDLDHLSNPQSVPTAKPTNPVDVPTVGDAQ